MITEDQASFSGNILASEAVLHNDDPLYSLEERRSVAGPEKLRRHRLVTGAYLSATSVQQ